MRTNPEAISRTKRLVGVASSIKNAGLNLASSWNAKWTWPLRYPKRVPITRLPRLEWYLDWLLPKIVRADRSLECFFGLGAAVIEVISTGPGIVSFSKSLILSSQKCEDEPKVKISSSSSSSSIFFFQWKYLLEKEKEESWGVLAVMVFIWVSKKDSEWKASKQSSKQAKLLEGKVGMTIDCLVSNM